MSLSVCLIASAPAARVAALLEPVRELADEIVIAADSRGDEATLAGYAALADRFFRLEYRLYERHLAWLHAQCSGDWILRLDDDEVLSAAFVARLPALLAARDVRQYWVARAWLFPDAGSVLDDPPWSVDFNNRLVRNDGTLRFRGLQHSRADPAEPCEYLEEPIYHLELLLAEPDRRRDKAVRYEVTNPLLIAPGGGRMNEAFYLPELAPRCGRDRCPRRTGPRSSARWARPGRTRPPRTATAVRHGGGGGPPLEGPRGPAIRLPRRDRAGRRAAHARARGGADRARSASPTRAPRCGPAASTGARRSARATTGCTPTARSTPRTACARASRATCGPGERILVPLGVVAPPEPGRYLLEVDLVHEDVRWFEQGCRVAMEVAEASPLPPTGPRLVESRRRRDGGCGARGC